MFNNFLSFNIRPAIKQLIIGCLFHIIFTITFCPAFIYFILIKPLTLESFEFIVNFTQIYLVVGMIVNIPAGMLLFGNVKVRIEPREDKENE